jgi:membrane-associated phospholipid phosphatase
MVAGAVLGWQVNRRDLMVLALAALPAPTDPPWRSCSTGRAPPVGSDPALLFPSGHAAMATPVALIALLALRVAAVVPRARLVVACLTVGYMLVIAVARLVETAHPLTDVLGGIAT